MRWGYHHADRNDVREAGQSLEDFARGTFRAAALMTTYIHAIPSLVRVVGEEPEKIQENSKAYMRGIISGLIGAVTGTFIGYTLLAKEYHPGVLLVPLATTVISG